MGCYIPTFPSIQIICGSIVAVLSIIITRGNAQSTVSVSPPPNAAGANNISQPILPGFVGFGIESSNLFSFTGNSDTNNFSLQLMQNLAGYAGGPSSLRIGGNTQDYMLYQQDMDEYTVKANPNPVGQGNTASDSMIIGPRYFEAINRFPPGTLVTFGLNMAYDAADYLDRVTSAAAAAAQKLDVVDLVSFELGNEPDLWLANGFRNGSWTGQVYVQEWRRLAQAIHERVLAPVSLPANFFEGPCTASTIGTTFEISELVAAGMQAPVDNTDGNSGDNNSNIPTTATTSTPYLKAWNQHDYLTFVGVTMHAITLEWVMDLDNTETQFAYWARQVDVALGTGLPYYLREMASVGPVGLQGISNTFGAALWSLNFFLYGATLNMSSVQIHLTDNSFAAPWQPTDRVPVGGDDRRNVRPSYYAFAAMAQLVGSGNRTARVARLADDGVAEASRSRVRMYGVYAGASGGLTSVVVINSRQVNASASNKGSLSITVALPPSTGGQTLYLSYLAADGADSTTGTVWNGMQYSDEDGTASTVAGSDSIRSVAIDTKGSATFDVRDSQAVVACIGVQLGSLPGTMNGSVPSTPSNTGGDGGQGNRAASLIVSRTGIAVTSMAIFYSLTADLVSSRHMAILAGIEFGLLTL